jgi:hypothetical protein
MVTQSFEESGLEELRRLSREISDRGKELVRGLGRARESIERVEKKRALWSAIREFKVSLVLEKLEPLVDFNIYNEVEALERGGSAAGLQRIILDMINDMENKIDADDVSKVDVPALKNKLKVLSILLELVFYIE